MDKTNSSLDISAIEEEVETSYRIEHFCEDCGYRSSHKGNFKRHMSKHHASTIPNPNTSTPSKMEGTIFCDQCGKTYKSKFGLVLHRKNKHENSYKHICDICGKGFNQSVQYIFHCSGHHTIRLENCSFCKTASFRSPGSLKRHLTVCTDNIGTTDTKQYKCTSCQASFPVKSRLQEHVKGMHRPARYACKECNTRFAWRSSLKSHYQHAHH